MQGGAAAESSLPSRAAPAEPAPADAGPRSRDTLRNRERADR